MSDGVIITLIICGTLLIAQMIGKFFDDGK